MFSKYLLILLPCLVMSVKISTLKRCACQEYGMEICDAYFYCSWNDGACGPLQCSNKAQQRCTGPSTSYDCIWDFSSNECVSHTYSCSEFGTSTLCYNQRVHGQNCSWSSTQGCMEFSCTNTSSCDLSQCSLINDVCDDPISSTLNCGAVTGKCLAADGNGKYCFQNNSGVCTAYDTNPQCYQLSDQLALCLLLGCYYKLATSTCVDLTCNVLPTADVCTSTYDNLNSQITICYWDKTFCREATETDLSTFTIENCLYETAFNYEWQDSKCQACKNLVSSEDSSSYSNLFVLFALLILGYL